MGQNFRDKFESCDEARFASGAAFTQNLIYYSPDKVLQLLSGNSSDPKAQETFVSYVAVA